MLVSGISIWIVLAWAIFSAIFYRIRYRKVAFARNPWSLIGIFVVSLTMFAFSAIIFVVIEWIRYYNRNKKK